MCRREFRATERTQQSWLPEFNRESATWFSRYVQARSRKCSVDGFTDSAWVSHFEDRLDRRRQISAFVTEDRRARAKFRNPARRVNICADLVIETPAAYLLAKQQNFGRMVRICNLDKETLKQPQAVSQSPELLT